MRENAVAIYDKVVLRDRLWIGKAAGYGAFVPTLQAGANFGIVE
jgi:hypothetical protein